MKKFIKNGILFVGIIGVILALMSNRRNIQDGKESVDITWLKYVNVDDSSYIDPQPTQTGFQAKIKGFRLFNSTDSACTILCQTLENTDTLSIVIAPLSWSPIVFKAMFRQIGVSDSLRLIGK